MSDGSFRAKVILQTAENSRLLKLKRKRLGLCIQCGKNPPRDGRVKCEKCHLDTSRRIKKKREDSLKAGKCARCYKKFPMPENSFCEICYLKCRAAQNLRDISLWESLREKLMLQDYRCVYSGRVLTLGKNAAIDHILPVAKFPELRYDLDNVQWVDDVVNRMKRELLPDEFLDLVKDIYHHTTLGS